MENKANNGKKFLRVIIYTRVSTKEQAESGYSIGEQEERLRAYCTAMDWTVFKVISDPGYSGASLDRPGLKEMENDVRHGRCDAVLVWKLDRLSRRQRDTLSILEDTLLSNGVAFISMLENFDTSTAFGRAMIGILSVFAQLERDQITERMSMGMDARAKAGHYHGSKYTPIGYDYDPDKGLTINEYEAAQVREIFDLYVNKRWSANRIRLHMREHHTNRYSSYARLGCIERILKLRVYIGDIEWRGDVYQGLHAPIIDESTFNAAQQLLAENASTRKGRALFAATSLTGGLIRCGACGAGCHCKHRTLKGGAVIGRIYCNNRFRSEIESRAPRSAHEVCVDIPVMDEQDVNDTVRAAIRELAFHPEKVAELSQADTGPADAAARIAMLTEREADLRAQIDRLIALCRVGGSMPIETIGAQIQSTQQELDRIEDQMSEARRACHVAKQSVTDTLQLLSTADAVLDSGDFDRQRQLLLGLIKNIIIKPDGSLEIHWAFVPEETL